MPGSRPFTGAVAMELLDSTGRRIAANFVNVATRSALSPRIEILGPRLVARYGSRPLRPASRVPIAASTLENTGLPANRRSPIE